MHSATDASEATVQPKTAQRRRGILFMIRRGLKWVGIAGVVVVVSGIVYQVIATELDKRGYLPPGQMVTVDGRQMHLYCTGQGSSPTIILEAGAFSFSSEWYWVQQQLATTHRVCSYDRAGNGWSEPVAGVRDGLHIVHELHNLLKAANIAGPYVLVGHSLGGVTSPIYAAEYPGEVQGIVLVDSAVPVAAAGDERTVERYKSDNQSAYLIMAGLVRVGALRFILSNEFRGYGYPPVIATQLTAFKSTVQAVDTWDAEVRLAQSELGQQAKAAADQGTRPLIVLWAGHPELTSADDRAKLKAIWSKVAVVSSNSVTRVIDGANHGSIIGDEQYAAQVSAAVLEVIEASRSGKPLSPQS
ncbi:MAG: alpha/beta hydrolase [Anaerolineae bacterium]|nr:alpha/beta hydrolase [Anaerolineae bacterium]